MISRRTFVSSALLLPVIGKAIVAAQEEQPISLTELVAEYAGQLTPAQDVAQLAEVMKRYGRKGTLDEEAAKVIKDGFKLKALPSCTVLNFFEDVERKSTDFLVRAINNPGEKGDIYGLRVTPTGFPGGWQFIDPATPNALEIACMDENRVIIVRPPVPVAEFYVIGKEKQIKYIPLGGLCIAEGEKNFTAIFPAMIDKKRVVAIESTQGEKKTRGYFTYKLREK
jgi:hypothetical protein